MCIYVCVFHYPVHYYLSIHLFIFLLTSFCRLSECGLSGVSCDLLAFVLKHNPSQLRLLDLSRNHKLLDSGLEKLRELVNSTDHKLETLRWVSVGNQWMTVLAWNTIYKFAKIQYDNPIVCRGCSKVHPSSPWVVTACVMIIMMHSRTCRESLLLLSLLFLTVVEGESDHPAIQQHLNWG